MTERQYLMQHILHLSSQLPSAATEKERENIEEALVFYTKELKRLDTKHNTTFLN